MNYSDLILFFMLKHFLQRSSDKSLFLDQKGFQWVFQEILLLNQSINILHKPIKAKI